MSQYIGVDGLDFESIPNLMQQSTSIFKLIMVNIGVICEHEFTLFISDKQIILIISENQCKMISSLFGDENI